jgi:hypothetical protein
MGTNKIRPRNIEERLVWYTILSTWVVYLFGGLYAFAPVLGWLLLAWTGVKFVLQDAATPTTQRLRFPAASWIWAICMLMMLVTLMLGHANFDLGLGKLVKSSIGWAKGWALLAIFVITGAALKIRPQLVYRAACMLGLQTLCLLPLLLASPYLGLPEILYTSPLKVVGGPGIELFEVELFGRRADTGSPRWRFFAPWAPAAGFVANVYLIFALREKNKGWRWIGISAAIAMCLMSQSRLALVVMIAVPLATWGLANLHRPSAWIAGAFGSFMTAFWVPQISMLLEQTRRQFRAARVASSQVRDALENIALQRWQTEAPIWGHGTVQNGSHLVEFMPIGSHHTWLGLLFVKGAVGFAALLLPILFSLVEMLLKAQRSRTARTGLAMMLILCLYSFGENLEILVYLFWPAMLMVGQASRQRLRLPTVTAAANVMPSRTACGLA